MKYFTRLRRIIYAIWLALKHHFVAQHFVERQFVTQYSVDHSEISFIIMGSCVTRDAFFDDIMQNWESWFKIKRLFSRSSLISLQSPSLQINLSEITNITPFECRYVFEDCNKEFFRYIQSVDCNQHELILDFIYEQCDLLKMDQHYITLTDEFNRSGLSSKLKGQEIHRFDPLTTKLWKESCLSFISRIQEHFPAHRVILHKAYWMENYIKDDGVQNFPDLNLIRRHNKLLREYYNFFEDHFPGIKTIEIKRRKYLANINHRWGLYPFHYEDGYYREFLRKLIALRQTSVRKHFQ